MVKMELYFAQDTVCMEVEISGCTYEKPSVSCKPVISKKRL